MKNITTIKQLAVKHNYYCSDNNYYDLKRRSEYKNFNEFCQEWFNSDIDMNLCFRWDISYSEEKEKYYMEIFLIQQRKGIFYPISIDTVTDEDVPKILEYLKKHQRTLEQNWKPL